MRRKTACAPCDHRRLLVRGAKREVCHTQLENDEVTVARGENTVHGVTRTAMFAAAMCVILMNVAQGASMPWVVYEGSSGPGVGKHVVLISGDEEYRSEEALPQLGKILATHHGFRCTVLFAIHPDEGYIDPDYNQNIPGLEALDTADLMIIFTRFRALPDDQMAHIERYLLAGKPVIGLRTSTHAFNFPADSPWAHYGNSYSGDKAGWEDGFGRVVLGEKWINHHGEHKHESTYGIVAPGMASHPVLRGITDGDIWGPTDVYGVRLPLPGDSEPLVLGEVRRRAGEFDPEDLFYGMRPDTDTVVEGEKNDPMMPVAWTKSYRIPGGNSGKAFTTTLGASTDLVAEGTRRLLVNAAYWALGMESMLPETGATVDLVGEFAPTRYEFRTPEYWRQRAMTVDEHRLEAED